MIKLIAADLDGTLLGADHVLNEATYEAIQAAKQHGIDFLVATGRDYLGAVRTMNGYNLQCDYVVASGAEIRDKDGNILQSIPMNQEQFPIIMERLKDLDVSVRFCVTGSDYVIGDEEEILQNMAEEAKQFLGLKINERIEDHKEFKELRSRMRCVSSLEELMNLNLPVYKVFVFAPEVSQIREAEERLADLEDIASASSFITNIELTNVQAQKGPIIKQYIEERGLSMEEVLVIGDSMNDYSMLSMEFGATVAMANGMDEIKKVAKYVTKSNLEDGVAYMIHKLIAEQEKRRSINAMDRNQEQKKTAGLGR